jgi:RimJ/RimL family protein N-acetyltransferase
VPVNPIRPDDVALRPWAAGDLDLLQRLLGDPRMMEHLGGPESPEKIRKRHARYLAMTGPGRIFAITLGPERQPVGSVGYWEMPGWLGDTVWEAGWSVLREFQGQGIATRGIVLATARAAAEGIHRSVHAFPSVDNGPSNAVCRKAGFTLLDAHDFEYLPGFMLRCNDWAFELPAAPGGGA